MVLDAEIAMEGDPIAPPSIHSRVQMFNGMSDSKTASGGKPPEIKPLLPLRSASKEGEGSSYISRSHVEKIMHQQRKVIIRR